MTTFDDIFAEMLNNKNLNPLVTELFFRSRKVNISLVFIIKSYFSVQENIRLISTHYFIIKIQNKRELQQSAFDHLSDFALKGFMNLYKNVLQNHIFLMFHITLVSDNALCFRKNLIERIQKLIMAIDDKIRDGKPQFYISRKTASI